MLLNHKKSTAEEVALPTRSNSSLEEDVQGIISSFPTPPHHRRANYVTTCKASDFVKDGPVHDAPRSCGYERRDNEPVDCPQTSTSAGTLQLTTEISPSEALPNDVKQDALPVSCVFDSGPKRRQRTKRKGRYTNPSSTLNSQSTRYKSAILVTENVLPTPNAEYSPLYRKRSDSCVPENISAIYSDQNSRVEDTNVGPFVWETPNVTYPQGLQTIQPSHSNGTKEGLQVQDLAETSNSSKADSYDPYDPDWLSIMTTDAIGQEEHFEFHQRTQTAIGQAIYGIRHDSIYGEPSLFTETPKHIHTTSPSLDSRASLKNNIDIRSAFNTRDADRVFLAGVTGVTHVVNRTPSLREIVYDSQSTTCDNPDEYLIDFDGLADICQLSCQNTAAYTLYSHGPSKLVTHVVFDDDDDDVIDPLLSFKCYDQRITTPSTSNVSKPSMVLKHGLACLLYGPMAKSEEGQTTKSHIQDYTSHDPKSAQIEALPEVSNSVVGGVDNEETITEYDAEAPFDGTAVFKPR